MRILQMAEEIARRLGAIDGVSAVAMGGSWARKRGLPGSNLDITLYYRSDSPPDIEDVHRVLRELDDHHCPAVLTQFGDWGPWINGGARLSFHRRRVDVYYRDLVLAVQAISECRNGAVRCHTQLSEVESLCNYIYMGEIHYCRTLFDREGELGQLKQRSAEYPPLLKLTLIQQYLAAANRAISSCRQSADRGDVFTVVSGLYRCVRSLTQVLFALNDRYFAGEKSAVKEISSFSFRPPRFGEVVHSVLSHPGENREQLRESVRRVKGLVNIVQQLCRYYVPSEMLLHTR